MMKLRLAVIAVFVTLSGPGIAMTAAEAAIQSERIDIAGRQRMLIQRIVKATCFVMADVDASRQTEQALADMTLFSDTLRVLIDGAPARNWSAETDAATLQALRDAHARWQVLQPAAKQIVHHDLNTVAVRQVIADTGPAVEAMNGAVARLAAAHQAGDTDPRAGHTLNMAGRQRMLSQKIAGDYCFLAAGIAENQYRQSLKESMTAFETTLDALIAADATTSDFIAPPSQQTMQHLADAQAIWSELKPILARGVDGRGQTHADMMAVSHLNLDLLRASAQAVSAYVQGMQGAPAPDPSNRP